MSEEINTYQKYVPNVYLAKCPSEHTKGEVIPVTTRHGKENDSIVFNLIYKKDGFFFYSIVRDDGFNMQEWAKKKAEKAETAAINAENRSDQYYQKSNKHRDFLSMGEPIKVGHHSEGRHRRMIEQANSNMDKCVLESKKAERSRRKASFYEDKSTKINESMPESIEYYEQKLNEAEQYHNDLKSGKIPREHSYSLTYAKKHVNELNKKLDLVKKLWG